MSVTPDLHDITDERKSKFQFTKQNAQRLKAQDWLEGSSPAGTATEALPPGDGTCPEMGSCLDFNPNSIREMTIIRPDCGRNVGVDLYRFGQSCTCDRQDKTRCL
ncbi:hypothetical protein BaRGS_00032274 [Batillaria attramentaria]|uniref:Uncharacterized protein n=1 Tax=Batillaria attramentaria TaxID=370345 RepID=A0ABD0JNT2_9CAEN